MRGEAEFNDAVAASHGEGCLCPDCIEDFDLLLDVAAGRVVVTSGPPRPAEPRRKPWPTRRA